jgi:hypothetical protein
MVDATVRKAVRKRVHLPNGGNVWIPCLEVVPFVVAKDQYQEHNLYLRNGVDADRKVHIRDVPSLDSPSQTIPVERIENFMVKTVAEQAQERRLIVTNLDPPPILPDGTNDPAHNKVHYVRYYQNNDPNTDTWVDVEFIDDLKVIVAAEQYQEWRLILRQEELGDLVDDPSVNYGPITVGTCDMSLPTGQGEASGIDPPYRFDPFLNIIQFNEGATSYEPHDVMWAAPPMAADISPEDNGYTGGWHLFSYLVDPRGDAGLSGVYNPLGGSIYQGEANLGPNQGDLDLRHVDQFFEPHTYDDTGSTAGTGSGDVRGYTRSEWEVGWGPEPGIPSGVHPNWYDQLIEYQIAQGFPGPYPNLVDFYFGDALAGSYAEYFEKRAAHILSPGPDNPLPVVAVRMTALGPNTTDHPQGRY